MINFIEHESGSYAPRTILNVRTSDITLAFAIDFNSAGEKLTRNVAERLVKPYQAINLISGFHTLDRIEAIIRIMDRVNCRSINIAGNGIYTLREKFEQPDLDDFIHEFLNTLIKHYGRPVEILSGGQTGIDEAGLKFGDKANLKTTCNFPKGWLFRDIRGTDIRDKKQFLQRFGPYNFLY